MAWYNKFQTYEEVLDETCVSRTGRKTNLLSIERYQQRCEVRSRLVARERDGELLRKDTTVSTRVIRDQQSRNEKENLETMTTHGTERKTSIRARRGTDRALRETATPARH